jgi:imidazole glycerol phosphate synthase glutamine amidotransferase subunit
MQSLRASGVDRALVARISAGMPTLCVCLGLQLLFEESDESPGVRGLGLVSGRVARFGRDVRVPQMGWNAVDVTARDGEPSSNMLERGAAFFANSYRVARAPEGWRCAMSEHGGRFVAAMERGGVLACQFHPELSGTYGQRLVSRWIASASASAEAAPC